MAPSALDRCSKRRMDRNRYVLRVYRRAEGSRSRTNARIRKTVAFRTAAANLRFVRDSENRGAAKFQSFAAASCGRPQFEFSSGLIFRSQTRPSANSYFGAGTPVRSTLEIRFADSHSRFRTYNDLCSGFRSWWPERQQSLHRRPTTVRHQQFSLASRRRSAAIARISRQSRYARRRVDHHVPQTPNAGGESSRSPGAIERTDCPRAARPEKPAPHPADAGFKGPAAHRKIPTILC